MRLRDRLDLGRIPAHLLEAGRPEEVSVLIQGLAASWLISPADLLAADGGDPYSAERLAAHRAALVEAVRRICTPRAGAAGETAPGAG